MAPYPQIHSRDDSADDTSNKLTPVVIGGIALIGAAILVLCVWLGIRAYRKRSREQRADGRQGAFLTVKGLISEDDEKAAPPRQVFQLCCLILSIMTACTHTATESPSLLHPANSPGSS